MRAVWSFWSKPFEASRRSSWSSEKHHLLSWILSLHTAGAHYRPTALYTDDAGARLLIDGLGLEFDEVHTSLNALAQHDPGWWATGKLFTYRMQQAPFVHVDSDVYLWRRLPRAIERAPLLAQHPEHFQPGAAYYEPEVCEEALAANGGGWLPAEWRWFRASGLAQRGENCGIFGGRELGFIQHYASQALAFVEHAANRRAWQLLGRKATHTVLVEQYLLAACVDYHRRHSQSTYRDLHLEYLFSSTEDAFTSNRAQKLGYTHLIADAKRDPHVSFLLEKRVAHDYPAEHLRCVRFLAGSASPDRSFEKQPGLA